MKSIENSTEQIRKLFEEYNFEEIYYKNTFVTPWPDGYRDINFKVRDKSNQNLVGELQIQYCPVKKFTEFVGHKSYEILRDIQNMDERENISKHLNLLTKYGYENAMKKPDRCCMSYFEKE